MSFNYCHDCFSYFPCAQLCMTLCGPLDCSPPGSSVTGIFQEGILEEVAISCVSWSSWCRDRTHVYCISCIDRQIPYHMYHLSNKNDNIWSKTYSKWNCILLPVSCVMEPIDNHGFLYLPTRGSITLFFYHTWNTIQIIIEHLKCPMIIRLKTKSILKLTDFTFGLNVVL